MPFRDQPIHISSRAMRFVLPAFVAICLVAAGTWMAAIAVLIPGGFSHMTSGAAILLAGILGIAGINLFATVVTVFVLESAYYEGRQIIVSQLINLIRDTNETFFSDLERYGWKPERLTSSSEEDQHEDGA